MSLVSVCTRRFATAHMEGPYRLAMLEGVSHWILKQAPEQLEALLQQHLAQT